MSGQNRTDFEVKQRIDALPPIVRAQLTEILLEMLNGSTQRAFASSSLATGALTTTTQNITGQVTVGANDQGYDVILYGDTSGKYAMWDTSADSWLINGALGVTGQTTSDRVAITTNGRFIIPTHTATATAGAATLAKTAGKITTEALTTAAGGTYSLDITNSTVALADYCFASVAMGTATTGTPVITKTSTTAGHVLIEVQNIHASAALNGTLVISFLAIPVT